LVRNAAQAVNAKLAAHEPGAGAMRGEVRVEALPEGEQYVCVVVADNGIGIHPDYEERLFTPFFSTKPRSQGTGLGLYVVKQILDDLNGRIEVESAVGQGTTFRILLPRYSSAARGN
jgi:two-component system NtrC family sensor kinase